MFRISWIAGAAALAFTAMLPPTSSAQNKTHQNTGRSGGVVHSAPMGQRPTTGGIHTGSLVNRPLTGVFQPATNLNFGTSNLSYGVTFNAPTIGIQPSWQAGLAANPSLFWNNRNVPNFNPTSTFGGAVFSNGSVFQTRLYHSPWFAYVNPGIGYHQGGMTIQPYYDYLANWSMPSSQPTPSYQPVASLYKGMDAGSMPMRTATKPTPAHIEVVVPSSGAQVWFDGKATAAGGTSRHFDSPDLVPGQSYSYTIKAAWSQDGKAMTAERVLEVGPGAQLVVDFIQTPPQVIVMR